MGMTDYVDVFHGNFEYELPRPEGVAASWFFLKAQTGNTHPGASLPFSAPSAGAYTGGYPNGYSPYWYNTHSRPERIMDPEKPTAAGFSHFHHSGTGAVGFYYNYFILTPVTGTEAPDRFARFPLEKEKGSPGFYGCTLGNIPVKIAAGAMSCAYRISFPGGGGTVVCDPELNGLFRDHTCEAPPGQTLSLERGKDYAAVLIRYAFPLAVYLSCPGAATIDVLSDGRLAIRSGGGDLEIFIGFSFNGISRAKGHALEAAAKGFEGMLAHAHSEWEKLLGAVEIDADGEERGVFYSSLYHALVKPCNITGDSPFWNDSPCWVDLATMWDASKVQLPLLFTLYGQESASLVKSLIGSAAFLGYYPNCFCLNPPDSETDMQARALGWYAVYDAFVRGVRGPDYAEALKCMERDLRRPQNGDFLRNGITVPYPSHTWDLSGACFAAGLMARALKKDDKADMFFGFAENWRKALDSKTGLMTSHGRFYEGNQWNYSFRLLPQTTERIAGGEEKFVRDLDVFFGFGAPPVVQNTDPRNAAGMKAGEALSRFEGFNNETDMEAPYAYIYARRHDRTAEICRRGMEAMFAPGRGGICGNDDSGGLSAMYLCNTLGLFPASGLPYLFIGSPGIRESRIRLGNGNSFRVSCKNYGRENRYVAKGALNGKPLNRAWLLVEELMAGGALELEMSPRPRSWDTEIPPSSERKSTK
ncbi:alpha-1 2-mannosidase [Spirochaetia bacterium]|nr:alpha-1 2-mannosidase [Spirochaetia bacterium]